MPSEYPTPLWRKLGIDDGDVVALVGAPPGFEIPALPRGVAVHRAKPARSTTNARRATADLTVWFVHDEAELGRGMAAMAPRAERSGLWIAWPKRTSPLAGTLTDQVVRAAAIRAGLVDFKVCSIDGDWSGLRFNRRAAALIAAPEETGTTKTPQKKARTLRAEMTGVTKSKEKERT